MSFMSVLLGVSTVYPILVMEVYIYLEYLNQGYFQVITGCANSSS